MKSAMMAKGPDKNIQSGNSRVKVTISGWVNRAVRFASSGDMSEFHSVENTESPSRLTIRGAGNLTKNISAVALTEFGTFAKGGRGTGLTIEQDNGGEVGIRHSVVSLTHKDMGTISLGHSARADSSAKYTGFTGTSHINSVATSTGADGIAAEASDGNGTVARLGGVGDVAPSRENRLLYKTPSVLGLSVSASLNQSRGWSLGASYSGPPGIKDIGVGAALAPDSNISARTDAQTIVLDTPLGRLPFTYNTDDTPTSGIGLAVWAGGEYQHPLGGPRSRWRLRIGGDVSRREYQSDAFDRMFLGAYAGPRWLISPATEASLLASARLSWLADAPEYRDLGLRFEGRQRLGRRLSASLDASWHDRRHPGARFSDGPVADLAAGLGWTAAPTVRLNAAAGWAMQRTERESQRNSSRWLRAGVTGLLPWGFTVGGSGTVRWTGYDGNWAPFVLGGGARRDRTWSLRLNVHNRALALRGFSPQISVVQEWRRSNAQLHDYRRTFGELRLVRLF